MPKRRPDKPAGWRAGRGALRQARDAIERTVFGPAAGRGAATDADFRQALSDLQTRRQLARQEADRSDNPNAYRNAMRRFQRYASGERGARIPPATKQTITDQARGMNRARRIDEIRQGTPRVTMVADATVSASARDNFGPGYTGLPPDPIDREALAEALERGDTWAVITLAYGDYWPGSQNQAITFDQFNDVNIEW
jgi:hypothetical protein